MLDLHLFLGRPVKIADAMCSEGMTTMQYASGREMIRDIVKIRLTDRGGTIQGMASGEWQVVTRRHQILIAAM